MENSNLITMNSKTLMEQIREEAARRVVLKGNVRGLGAFLDLLVEESVVVWLEFFPEICAEVRKLNHNKQKLLMEVSQKGRFTDSYGWSDNYEFQFQHEYTPELYYFMTSYVYADFFSNEEKKTAREFMRRIMKGDDAIETLMWAKKRYGSNNQKEIVTTS